MEILKIEDLLNDVERILPLSLIIIVAIVGYLKVFFASSVELLLMKQKESNKRDVCAGVIFWIPLAVLNVVLPYNKILIIGGCVIIVCLWIISFVVHKILKKKNMIPPQFIMYYQFIGIVISTCVSISIVKDKTNINIFSLAIIGAVIETFFLIVMFNGFRSEVANVIIENEEEKFYFYRKIDDETFMCGDSNKINEANKIIMIKTSDIINRKYYLHTDNKIKDKK